MADWLPQQGAITGLPDGEMVLRREHDRAAWRVSVRGHRVSVEEVADPPPETVVLPAGDRFPERTDGKPLPPFDEAPLLTRLPAVPMASVVAVFSLENFPFGERALRCRFVDGRLTAMDLVEDRYADLEPGLVPPDGADFAMRTSWEKWCGWRAGDLSGEQFIEGAALQASWPYIALMQGLMEADEFAEARRALPAPSDDLRVLRLVKW
jgi:hypothetical protein